MFKLEQIDARFHVVRQGGVALDLGCAPGSWSQWLGQHGMRTIGVDEQPGPWIVKSVYEVDPAEIGPVDLVVSDMAPSTTGDRFTDHVRQIGLATRALDLAEACLRPGGAFVCKVFDGEDANAFVERVRTGFTEMRRLKPDATRGRSVEFFVVGKGKKQEGRRL